MPDQPSRVRLLTKHFFRSRHARGRAPDPGIGPAAIERVAFELPRGTISLALALCVALGAAVAFRHFRRRTVRALEFDEKPDVTQALGLGG